MDEETQLPEPPPSDDDDGSETNWIGIGLAFGLCGGVVVGILTNNFAMWIGVGLAVGVSVGVGLSSTK